MRFFFILISHTTIINTKTSTTDTAIDTFVLAFCMTAFLCSMAMS